MRLRRRHILIYVLTISAICLLVVFQSYDKYSRNKTINNKNKQVIEKHLSDEDKKFLIDNNINAELFMPFIKEKGFKIENYEYYNIIYQYNKKLDKSEIVEKGNKLVEEEFTLNALKNIFKNKLYTLDQLIELAINPSPYYASAKPEFYPNNAYALSNVNYYIADYKPSDLVLINVKYTKNNKKMYLKEEANNQLNLMCDNLKLLTKKECGGLKIEYGFLSYDYILKNQKSLGSFNKPGHSDFQLGKTISFTNSKDFDKNSLYLWLLDNSYRYGFIQRYPDSKAEITGVINQSGVFRYVGVEQAKGMVQDQKSVEEKRGE
ncbi:LAS superfamily LD-carboxypeptidase LdcB [Bacilli bacterium PM5-3]|nr:LAS superfamily LD-carboxypeptidase LdcB [Bacilli bacterium PM5-3]